MFTLRKTSGHKTVPSRCKFAENERNPGSYTYVDSKGRPVALHLKEVSSTISGLDNRGSIILGKGSNAQAFIDKLLDGAPGQDHRTSLTSTDTGTEFLSISCKYGRVMTPSKASGLRVLTRLERLTKIAFDDIYLRIALNPGKKGGWYLNFNLSEAVGVPEQITLSYDVQEGEDSEDEDDDDNPTEAPSSPRD